MSPKNPSEKILIVGLGNILLSDEGIGIRVLEQLEKEGGLPDTVELILGETGGLALLPYFDKASAVIFIDAAEFEGTPGEVRIYKDDEVHTERYIPLSVHDIGLRDLISLISLKNAFLPKIIVVGIKPIKLEPGIEISSELNKAITYIVMMIRGEVERLALLPKTV